MQSYLEPQDDGLLMRETGAWAAEKLDYLARYIDVFETAMRRKWPVRNMVRSAFLCRSLQYRTFVL